MKTLVDFDNVPIRLSTQGPTYLADTILTAITKAVGAPKNLDLRLYGGWDQSSRLTPHAQTLSASIASCFPKILKVGNPPVSVHITMSLARSLEILPRHVLHNTLRWLPFSKPLKCTDPKYIGCSKPGCPVSPAVPFFSTGRCPVAGCSLQTSMLLESTEQKLVDAMMVADLIYLANTGHKAVGIVTSDDDVVPGILTAVAMGTHVIHIRSRTSASATSYLAGVGGTYTPVELEQ